MDDKLQRLLSDVEAARALVVDSVSDLSRAQVLHKLSDSTWSILDITEHLVWAEQIGICGMFNAIEGLRRGRPIWSGHSPNNGLSIEEIIEKTWQPKEKAPMVAEPKWGGSIDFWILNLKNNHLLLEELQLIAKSLDLTLAIYPHPISGPLNVIQRLEFLRFHMERHLKQVHGIKTHHSYPNC